MPDTSIFVAAWEESEEHPGMVSFSLLNLESAVELQFKCKRYAA